MARRIVDQTELNERLLEVAALERAPDLARLLQLSAHADPMIRRATTMLLWRSVDDPVVWARLIAMLQDPDENVARKVIIAAAYHKATLSPARFAELLAHPDDRVARLAPLLITGAQLEPDLVGLLVERASSSPVVAINSLRKLASRLRDPRVSALFIQALKSPVVDVRATAYRTLATAAHKPDDVRRAFLDAMCDLPEILGPTLREIAGQKLS